MAPDTPIDLIYERQWSSLGNVVRTLSSLGRMGRLYGGFPKFRYTKAGIPADIIRTFPAAALWNHAAGRLRIPSVLQLDEPRWVGNWVARSQDLAPTVWANGTAHRFLFPKLKDTGRTLILERGSSHPEPFYFLEQKARREAGFPFSSELPASFTDEIEKNTLADFLIAGSEMIREGYVRRGFPAERAFACTYGIDPQQFPYTDRVQGPYPSLRIGVVGIVGFRKGLLRAIRLGEWARDRKLPVEIHFVGPIYDHEARTILAKTKSRVHLHGVVKGAELVSLFHTFHAYCLPSYEDGFGISVLEAMSTGLPCIVSDTTGAKEAIRHGVNGWILSSFDFEEFDQELTDAFKSPDLLYGMGEAARDEVLNNYTTDHYFARIEKALSAISIRQQQ